MARKLTQASLSNPARQEKRNDAQPGDGMRSIAAQTEMMEGAQKWGPGRYAADRELRLVKLGPRRRYPIFDRPPSSPRPSSNRARIKRHPPALGSENKQEILELEPKKTLNKARQGWVSLIRPEVGQFDSTGDTESLISAEKRDYPAQLKVFV